MPACISLAFTWKIKMGVQSNAQLYLKIPQFARNSRYFNVPKYATTSLISFLFNSKVICGMLEGVPSLP